MTPSPKKPKPVAAKTEPTYTCVVGFHHAPKGGGEPTRYEPGEPVPAAVVTPKSRLLEGGAVAKGEAADG